MSSEHDSNSAASVCIDGQTSPTGAACKTKCTAGDADENPYLQLDMGKEVIIHKIKVTNKNVPGTSTGERIVGATVTITARPNVLSVEQHAKGLRRHLHWSV